MSGTSRWSPNRVLLWRLLVCLRDNGWATELFFPPHGEEPNTDKFILDAAHPSSTIGGLNTQL